MGEIKLSAGARTVGNKLLPIEYFESAINRRILAGLLDGKPAAQIPNDGAIPIDVVYRAQARWAAVLEKIAEPDSIPAIVK
jgi:hypothetical protein